MKNIYISRILLSLLTFSSSLSASVSIEPTNLKKTITKWIEIHEVSEETRSKFFANFWTLELTKLINNYYGKANPIFKEYKQLQEKRKEKEKVYYNYGKVYDNYEEELKKYNEPDKNYEEEDNNNYYEAKEKYDEATNKLYEVNNELRWAISKYNNAENSFLSQNLQG